MDQKILSSVNLTEFNLTPEQLNFLRSLSERYIWWETPEVVLSVPFWAASQGMRDGDIAEMRKLYKLFSKEYLRAVLKNAKAGWFDEVSWAAWHNWLYSEDELEKIPPLPIRGFYADL